MKMVEAAGIHYQLHPAREEPGDQAVILLHGAGGNYLSWPPEIRRLPGWNMVAIDLPGHGKSSQGSQASIYGYAQVVFNWLQMLQLEPVILIGHSMGSAIALQLAVDWPDLVSGLVVLGSGARLPVNPLLLETTQDPTQFQTVVSKIIDWSFSPTTDLKLKKLAARRMMESQPGVLYNDFLACSNFNLSNRLVEIKCPTLILCGADDKMTTPRQSQFLAENIPSAWFEVIPAAGHMLMLEQPGATAARLRDFLVKVS